MKHKSAVLSIWELLELILLCLDMRTLLLSQRVCRHWHEVIMRSKPIQQALFFMPIEPTNVPHDARTRNPLLEEILWPRFVNPEWRFPGLDKQIIAKLKSSYKRMSASWRRMLIQQPPTSVIGIVELFTHQNRTRQDTHHEQILVKPEQKHLRMGHLYYKGSKINLLSSCRETWVLSCWTAPQDWQEEYLKDDRGPILNVALKECDIVIFTQFASSLIRGVNVEKKDMELWLDELLVNSRKYKPKRSGGVNSKYYRCGYSKMALSE